MLDELRRDVERDPGRTRRVHQLLCKPAGRGQHRAVDLGDQPAVLGHADERLGRDQAHGGVAQACQRLDTDDAAAARRDDRLEARLEGLRGERAHEGALCLEALHGLLVEALVEQGGAIAAALLGGIQSRVGIAQKGFRRDLALVRECDARACGHAHLTPVDRERLRQHGAHLLDQAKRLGLVLDLVANDREFVAPDARNGVARTHDRRSGDGSPRPAGGRPRGVRACRSRA